MIILLCILSFALAEPPVGDSYLDAAHFSHDQTSNQQYFPADLTVPSVRKSKSSNAELQNLSPSTRGISQEYGPPNIQARLSQEYGLPTSGITSFRSGISKEYGTPISHSSQYDFMNSDLNHSFSSASNSGVSQRYGVPSSRISLSGLHISPSQRSSPSTQYGTPQFQSSNEYTAHPSPVQKYGVSTFRRAQTRSKSFSHDYGTPSNSFLQESLGPSNSFSARLQNADKYPSQSYGTPARSLSSQYGTPSSRNSVSRVRESSLNSNTNAFASPYPSARTPSIEYGAPSFRSTLPSQVYGVPEGSLVDQGYDYARSSLEQLNQEPANYDFAYKISDDETGSDFGHTESRQLDKAEGTYFVLLPDGTKQVVEYEADEDGFKPRISVEPANSEIGKGPY